jgi:hypothetical protein
LAQKAEDYGVCVVLVLNQLRTKPGVMYGDPIYTPGGDAKEFYFSHSSSGWARRKSRRAKVPRPRSSAWKSRARFIKNKVSTARSLKATWRFMFQKDGTGRFDVERSLIEFLAEQKILKAARPGYVVWDGKEIHREKLARDIEAQGKAGMNKLKAMLPATYEPPIVAEVDAEAEVEAA